MARIQIRGVFTRSPKATFYSVTRPTSNKRRAPAPPHGRMVHYAGAGAGGTRHTHAAHLVGNCHAQAITPPPLDLLIANS
jgi:hypothetical protein